MTDPTRRRLLELGSDGKPTHPYVHSSKTDLAATFKRIARQQAAAQKPAAEPIPIKRARKA